MAKKTKNGDIPFWLIVLGFMFGFWPGAIMLGIQLVRNHNREVAEQEERQKREAREAWERTYTPRPTDTSRPLRTYQAPSTGRRPGETTEEYHLRLSREGVKVEKKTEQPSMRYGMNADGTYRYSYTAPKIEVTRRPAAPSRKEAVKEQFGMLLDERLDPKSGKGLKAAGAVLLCMGLFGTFMTVLSGMISGADLGIMIVIASILVSFLCIPGAAMNRSGRKKNKRVARCRTYATIIGNRRWVEIQELADAIPIRYGKCVKDLQWMLSEGLLHGMYIDGTDKILTYPEEAAPKAPDTRQAPVQTDNGDFPEAARIRAINVDIQDSYVSQRMDRLEELTRKILTYAKEHPEKESSLRQFRNHYLPKTYSILESYARMERTGVAGGNISAAMKDVEAIMDKLVLGFEKQLDALFDSEALDVTTDVSVLENMMTMEGLSDLDPFGAGSRTANRQEVK